MKKNHDKFRYVASACFGILALINMKAFFVNQGYSAISSFFDFVGMAGYGLVAASVFASKPILTAAGGGALVLQAGGYYVIGGSLQQLLTYREWSALIVSLRPVLGIAGFVLLTIAGLKKKNGKVFGISAAVLWGLSLILRVLLNFGDGSSFSGAYLMDLLRIVGAITLGLAMDTESAK